MKKLLFVLLLFIGSKSFAQYPTGYTGINSRYDWLSGKFRGLHAPSGASAALASGQWTGAGALFVDTSGGGIGLYYYNGLNWIRLRDTTEAGGGTTDTAIISTKARVMQVVDSLSAAGWAKQNLQSVLTAGSTLTVDNTVNGGGFNLYFQNNNVVSLQADNGLGTQYTNFVFEPTSGTIQSARTGGVTSLIVMSPDSIRILPGEGGKLNIDSLRKKSYPNARMMTWNQQTGIVSSTMPAPPFASLTTAIVDVDTKYAGFPWPVQKDDTTIVFVKYSTTHADAGPMRYYKSWNGGRSWTTGANVTVGGTEISVTSLQTGIFDNRITICYTEDTYDSVKFAYSDNGGVTFTASTALPYQVAWTGSPSIQSMFNIVSDTIFSAHYEIDTDSSRAFLIYSANNGVSWARGNTVLLQSGSVFPDGRTSEWSCVITEMGTMDANTKLASLHRNEDSQFYTFVSTANGFATSTEDVTNLMYEFGAQIDRAPTNMVNIGGIIYIVCGNRRVNSAYGIEWVTIPAASFYTNTQSDYSKVKRSYVASAYTKSAAIDFGYPMLYDYNGRPYITFYDVSPLYHTASEGSDDDVRSVNFPLLDRGYSEMYNDANQSITDSTQTLVSFPDLWLDCMGSWDYDGAAFTVDSVWEAKEDGWYMINSIATFEANSTGSYRQMYVVVVDPGVNTTATNQLISKTTIAGHVSNSDFNRLECNGMAYIKQGEQIKVFVKHDATSALNLLNTSRETMATIKITIVR